METAIFSVVLYFMSGLVEEAGRWFYFYGLLTLVNVSGKGAAAVSPSTMPLLAS